MFGVFVDYISKKIIKGNAIHIEILDELTRNISSCESFKGISEKEMNEKVITLKEFHEGFEVISVGSTLNNIEH